MLGAPLCQRFLLSGFTLRVDLLSPPEVDVRRGNIAQRLVVTPVIVVSHESSNRLPELPGEIMVLQADDVLERAVVAFNLALGHGMKRLATRVAQAMRLKISCEICGDVSRAVVGEQTWTMLERHLGHAGGSQRDDDDHGVQRVDPLDDLSAMLPI